jgi:hypothetical protein
MVTFSAPSIARAIITFAATLALATAGTMCRAQATDTTTLTTTANVAPDCTFASTYQITVPTLDTVNGTPSGDGSTSIFINCNEGTNSASTIELGANAGAHGPKATNTKRAMLSGNGDNALDYKLGLVAAGAGTEFPVCVSVSCGAALSLAPTVTKVSTKTNVDQYEFSIYAYVSSSYTQTAIASNTSYSDTVYLYINP